MTELWLLLGPIGWLACAALSYPGFRVCYHYRFPGAPWAYFQFVWIVGSCLVFGPLNFLTLLVLWVEAWAHRKGFWDRKPPF